MSITIYNFGSGLKAPLRREIEILRRGFLRAHWLHVTESILCTLPALIIAAVGQLLCVAFSSKQEAYIGLKTEKTYELTTKLKVISYNVAFMPTYIQNGLDAPCIRAKRIAKALISQDFDLLCLQEAFDFGAVRALCDELKDFHIIHSVGESEWGLNSGLMVVSKQPIEFRSFNRFTNGKREDWLANKGVLKVFTCGISVVNTHLQAIKAFSDVRIEQMDVVKQCYGNEGILAGDFNIMSTKESGALVKRFPAVEMAQSQEGSFLNKENNLDPSKSIDYIFGKGEQTTTVKVPTGLSDHAPIMRTIYLQPH